MVSSTDRPAIQNPSWLGSDAASLWPIVLGVQSLEMLLRSNHGVVRTQDLLRVGLSRPALQAMLQTGALVRLRRGWYSCPQTAVPTVRSAVSYGGVLGCASALGVHGLWRPADGRLHVRLSDFALRHTRPASVVSCTPLGDPPRMTGSVDRLGVAIRSAASCLSAEDLVAVLDSALHADRVDRDELADLLDDYPAETRGLVDRCDGRSESGTESLVRYRLTSRRVKVRPQVHISGVGRVDFLVGKRLVIEVDSRAHHTSDRAYRADRRRDRKLVRLGYRVIRITYEEVLYDWAEVEDDILAIVRSGDHLREPLHRRPRRNRTSAQGRR